MTWPTAEGVFRLGDLAVERGGVIADARLSWQSHGRLNDARDNAIIYPCSYTASHSDLNWLIGPNSILDPQRWFIVIPDMFSNGLSSSASDTADFPLLVTMYDNVLAQRRLLREHFGVERLAAAYGFSMGAGQAYHWAAAYPDAVDRAIVVCGSARTSVHNKVFLSGLLRTLEAAPEYLGDGQFSSEPHASLRAFAHIYAGWGLSQDFYRAELFRTALGIRDLQTFLRTEWEDMFSAHRAADLYAQALTWSEADISASPRYGGDLNAALRTIRARVLLLPSETDLYFRVADNAAELEHLTNAAMHPIPSIWGHRAGSPQGIQRETEFLRKQVSEWLQS
jgi:homoserine O-acetyltransferase